MLEVSSEIPVFLLNFKFQRSQHTSTGRPQMLMFDVSTSSVLYRISAAVISQVCRMCRRFYHQCSGFVDVSTTSIPDV